MKITMAIAEKLKVLKDRVNAAAALDENFGRLIGIELYDFIQSNNDLKNEFDRRLNYLSNLAKDGNFNRFQDDLFETIQKILKSISLKEVEKRQGEWKNKWVNIFKNQNINYSEKEAIWMTLPQLYQILQKKNNYYRLGDEPDIYSADGEVSSITNISHIKKQYERIKEFFEVVFWNKESNEKPDELLKKFNTDWYKLDEFIYRTPVNFHLPNFEGFFFDCMKFYQRDGYERYRNAIDFFNAAANRQQFAGQLKRIKDNALIIIDDLSEASTTEKEEADIDFDSKAERQACEKKWDVLQAIWSIYRILDNPKNIPVPKNSLIIKGRSEDLIDMILSDLSRAGCFDGFQKDENNYIFPKINKEKLTAAYKKTEEVYKKFVAAFLKQKESQTDAKFSSGVIDKSLMMQEIERRAEEGEKFKELEEKITGNILSKIRELPKIKKGDAEKLKLYPESGDVEYKNEVNEIKNGNKDYALLCVLNKNKNTTFNVEDIKNHCNPLVNKDTHKFRKEKDIDDTLRQIRFKLKVKKGAYFPILKRGIKNNKSWIWIEK